MANFPVRKRKTEQKPGIKTVQKVRNTRGLLRGFHIVALLRCLSQNCFCCSGLFGVDARVEVVTERSRLFGNVENHRAIA